MLYISLLVETMVSPKQMCDSGNPQSDIWLNCWNEADIVVKQSH